MLFFIRETVIDSGVEVEAVAFFKERLPDTFDFKRVKKIQLNVKRTMKTFTGKITVEVDDKTFSYSLRGSMS